MERRPWPQPISPAAVLRDSLDRTGRTGPGLLAAIALLLGGLWLLHRLGPGWIEGWSRGHEALAVVPLAALLVPAFGHVLRRLNDMGWPGWWAWGLLIPWARWGLLLLLLLVPSSQRRRLSDSGWRVLGFGIAGVLALVLAGSLLWTTAPVVAQGMRPALLPGDLVLVRRMPAAVKRGDIVAFRLPGQDEPRVARVIGLPGEAVAVEAGAPVIDGARAGQVADGVQVEVFGPAGPQGVLPVCGNGIVGLGALCRTRRLVETLPGGAAYPVLDAGVRPLDAAEEVRVPADSLYVLGDDRDAARDSRLAVAAQGTGLVPRSALIGRVDRVLASSSAAVPWDPRGWRPSRWLGAVR